MTTRIKMEAQQSTPTTFFDTVELRSKMKDEGYSAEQISSILMTSMTVAQVCATVVDEFMDGIVADQNLPGVPIHVAEGVVLGVGVYIETLKRIGLKGIDVDRVVKMAKLMNIITARDIAEAKRSTKQ